MDSNLNHLAIIMDGNGRWAKSRGYDRTMGHIKGARVAKKIIEFCTEQKLPYLTLYAFSTENWLRPQLEVNFLMRLLFKNLKRERKTLVKNNIRFQAIGDLSRLPDFVAKEVAESIEATKNNTGMVLTFALSYGGRQEITKSVQKIAEMVKSGDLNPEEITEELVAKCLPSHPLPDADLIIRTSGENRLSNFLMWQSAYSEIYITDKLWPDYKEQDLIKAISVFQSTERRYGKTSEQIDSQDSEQTHSTESQFDQNRA